MNSEPLDFDDIRPYEDHEIAAVLSRLGKSPWLVSGIREVFLPRTPRVLAPFVDRSIRFYLKMKFKGISTILQFQRQVSINTLLHHVVVKTIGGLSQTGLENLDSSKTYLFISNHRDIVLDPALLNYLLIKKKFSLTQIAIGDNLLLNETISDLIRINRSFIVKRSLPLREKIQASIKLSHYIQYVLFERKESVWLAQREGRAKDGIDVTNPAILKMLYFSHRKTDIGFSEYINQCNIVPVSISYEFDPCDRFKAWELHRKKTRGGGHVKGKYEDLISITAGIKGFKGRVHYTFGKPLSGEFESEKMAAEEIDRSIQGGYVLWAANYIAYDLIHGSDKFKDRYSDKEAEEFLKRYNRLSPDVRRIFWESYANPVLNKMRLGVPV